jgi:hypothetical protein
MPDWALYFIFATIVVSLLAIDVFIVQRDPHAVSVKEAATWSLIWISVAIIFGLLITQFHEGGSRTVVEYFVSYIFEKSLSVNNVFFFVLVFTSLQVPRQYRHRVLFYGVLGAIVMRTILILTNAALVARFDWIISVFGQQFTWVRNTFGATRPLVPLGGLIHAQHRAERLVGRPEGWTWQFADPRGRCMCKPKVGADLSDVGQVPGGGSQGLRQLGRLRDQLAAHLLRIRSVAHQPWICAVSGLPSRRLSG